MMWPRMVVAPWWVLFLVDAVASAIVLILFTAVLYPFFFAARGWLGGSLILLVLGLAAAVSIVRVQTQLQRSYAPALTGLNVEQRGQILKALRRGEIPADPHVLVSALRVGLVTLAHRDRAARWQKTAKWWAPGLYIVLAIVSFTILDVPRWGWLCLGIAMYFAARYVQAARRSGRLPDNVERLRAAVAAIPEAASATAETQVALPPRRMKVSVLLAVVVGTAFGATMLFWGTPRQTPECRAAYAAVDYIHAHKDLLDAAKITEGGPDLSKYQEWSDQLRSYAQRVSAPNIARHLDRIVELSSQAVSLVADIRKDPLVSPPPDVIGDHEKAYQKIANELVEEDSALIPICRPHN
jgi:hypothetical protein